MKVRSIFIIIIQQTEKKVELYNDGMQNKHISKKEIKRVDIKQTDAVNHRSRYFV